MLDWAAGRAVVMGIVRSDSPLSIVWHGAGGMRQQMPLLGSRETREPQDRASRYTGARKTLGNDQDEPPAPASASGVRGSTGSQFFLREAPGP